MENENFVGYTDPVDNKSDNDYIKASDFENLKLSQELIDTIKYEGGGEKSSNKGYDASKRDFLEGLGIEIPGEWVEDRAMLLSAFIITGHIIVLEDIRRTLEATGVLESFDEYIRDRNIQIEEARRDAFGLRKKVHGTDKRVENFYTKHGLSDNPEKKGSREELQMIIKYIFEQLSK